jgi:hypothetical protein
VRWRLYELMEIERDGFELGRPRVGSGEKLDVLPI